VSQDWVAEAAKTLAVFHRAGLVLGLAVFVALVVRHWEKFSSFSGPVASVITSTLSGVAIAEAVFPLYWILWKNRPVTDIAAGWLDIYVYVGAALAILFAVISIRMGYANSPTTS
jgi:hypothetical protein